MTGFLSRALLTMSILEEDQLSLIHISEPTRLQKGNLVCRLLLEKKKKKKIQKKKKKKEKKK